MNSVQYIKDQAHLDPEAADLLSPKEMALMDGSPKMRQVGERLNNRPSHLSRDDRLHLQLLPMHPLSLLH